MANLVVDHFLEKFNVDFGLVLNIRIFLSSDVLYQHLLERQYARPIFDSSKSKDPFFLQ